MIKYEAPKIIVHQPVVFEGHDRNSGSTGGGGGGGGWPPKWPWW
ncbi:hypothetical protein [Cohnella fermenti]|nr:hypothetical protein [Cohnella fermenti]